jgi:hypothetical protein
MKKRLSEYFKDLVIITVSISIAFWVENYRENRKESQDTQRLLVTIRSEMKAEEEYLSFLIEHANKHSHRFDTLIQDLADGKIENNQLLIDVAVAYIPYVSDKSEMTAFESLKNSGLLSNIKNDTVVTAMYDLNTRIKSNLIAYNDAWKKSQERVKELIVDLYGSKIKYDFKQSRLVFNGQSPVIIEKDLVNKISFELTSWITIMKQHTFFVDRQKEMLHGIKPLLEKEMN